MNVAINDEILRNPKDGDLEAAEKAAMEGDSNE